MNNPEPLHQSDQTELLTKLTGQDHTDGDKDKFMVTVENAATVLPDLIKKGLKVIFICHEGRGTSRTMADNFIQVRKIPAVYLRYGIKELAIQPELIQQQVIKAISNVPIVVSTMPYREYLALNIQEKTLFELLQASIRSEKFYQSKPDDLPPPYDEIITRCLHQ